MVGVGKEFWNFKRNSICKLQPVNPHGPELRPNKDLRWHRPWNSLYVHQIIVMGIASSFCFFSFLFGKTAVGTASKILWNRSWSATRGSPKSNEFSRSQLIKTITWHRNIVLNTIKGGLRSSLKPLLEFRYGKKRVLGSKPESIELVEPFPPNNLNIVLSYSEEFTPNRYHLAMSSLH